MRLSAQEEYGLRCLIHLAEATRSGSLTISEIAERESLTTAHAAKVMRLLRKAGLVQSVRGQHGGYRLSRRPEELRLSELLEALDEPLHTCACERYSGREAECVHAGDCSIRSLWLGADRLFHEFFSTWTLADLSCTERTMTRRINRQLTRLPGLSTR